MTESPEAKDPEFAQRGTKPELEEGSVFRPKFDDHGLIPAIATDSETGEVLMFAWMNAQALAATIETQKAHFWSRSRSKLWCKGEESGNTLSVTDIRTDCDQDAIWLLVRVEGDGVACHTKRRTCFYRSISQVNDQSTYKLTFDRD